MTQTREEQAVLVRQARLRKAQIVKDAAATPQGRALLDLIAQEFGMPQIGGTEFRAMASVGQWEVAMWLARAEHFKGIDDD